MKSSARSVAAYIASLPPDRRAGIEVVRKVILKSLDKDSEECMLYGVIGYAVPHRVWPLGYHCDPRKPLLMAALSSQKNALTVSLMSIYSDKTERAWFAKTWAKSGKKLRMGGACVRFRTVEDAALDAIGEAIRRMPAKKYVARYVKSLAATGRGPDGKKLAKKTGKSSIDGAASKKAAKKAAKTVAKDAAKKVAKKALKQGAKRAVKQGAPKPSMRKAGRAAAKR